MINYIHFVWMYARKSCNCQLLNKDHEVRGIQRSYGYLPRRIMAPSAHQLYKRDDEVGAFVKGAFSIAAASCASIPDKDVMGQPARGEGHIGQRHHSA